MDADIKRNPRLTALGAGLISCHSCRMVCRRPKDDPSGPMACPRCGAALHLRKPGSLSRTWALVTAAAILYIPANLLPVAISTSLGSTQADTIFSGVHHFMLTGNWHIALIIFVASLVVPLLKLFILIYLLLSIHFKSMSNPVEKTRLFRLTEAVGRWSMVDVFAVTIVVALVKMEALASVEVGPGMPFFAAVVVITMLAAHSFDPRLIWDAMQEARI